jgi:hypothetical protein
LKRIKAIPFFCNNRALSYAISAVIITGTTVMLVLVASIYAYQIMEQQKGLAEFEAAKKSIIVFNDGLENVAWKTKAVRATRFSIQYGYLQLIPDANSISINATVDGVLTPLSNSTFPGSTGVIKYWIETKYVTFGGNYESYVLGSPSSVVSEGMDSYGRAVIEQQPNWVSITLDYRVRVMRTAVIKVNNVDTNYVDIWVIKVKMPVPHAWSYINEFDLKASCDSVQTVSYEIRDVSNQASVVSVRIGDASDYQVPITLVTPGDVVFNVIISEVQVSV